MFLKSDCKTFDLSCHNNITIYDYLFRGNFREFHEIFREFLKKFPGILSIPPSPTPNNNRVSYYFT